MRGGMSTVIGDELSVSSTIWEEVKCEVKIIQIFNTMKFETEETFWHVGHVRTEMDEKGRKQGHYATTHMHILQINVLEEAKKIIYQ